MQKTEPFAVTVQPIDNGLVVQCKTIQNDQGGPCTVYAATADEAAQTIAELTAEWVKRSGEE